MPSYGLRSSTQARHREKFTEKLLVPCRRAVLRPLTHARQQHNFPTPPTSLRRGLRRGRPSSAEFRMRQVSSVYQHSAAAPLLHTKRRSNKEAVIKPHTRLDRKRRLIKMPMIIPVCYDARCIENSRLTRYTPRIDNLVDSDHRLMVLTAFNSGHSAVFQAVDCDNNQIYHGEHVYDDHHRQMANAEKQYKLLPKMCDRIAIRNNVLLVQSPLRVGMPHQEPRSKAPVLLTQICKDRYHIS